MYVFDKLTAFLAVLCRVCGTTPDTIAAFKSKSKAPQFSDTDAAARVKNQIVS